MPDGATSVRRMIYEPRVLQAQIHERLVRFNALVCHRGFGKTVLAINQLIASACRCNQPDAEFMYIAPYRQQAKAVAWNLLLRYSEPLRDADPNIAELWVKLFNGTTIRLYGADNPDSLRGVHPHGVVFDEYGDMDPAAWTQVIRAALSTHLGWAIFIGTPKGRNAFCELYDAALEDEDWYAGIFKASQTGVIPASELTANRKMMSAEEYEQEFECSFQAPNIGAYYGKEMALATDGGRISRCPYEPRVPVTTAWDLGIDDSTAIWFCQQVGREVRLIDYYENSGEGLAHYVKQLQARPYVYGDHLLPHDTEVKELGTGLSRVEVLQGLGINPTIVPLQRVEDGINAVRMLLPRCYFDEKKSNFEVTTANNTNKFRGLASLRAYEREWVAKSGTWRASPKHNWASHGADAFRYLALGLKEPTSGKPLKYPGMAIV